jgi:hypothetical protein
MSLTDHRAVCKTLEMESYIKKKHILYRAQFSCLMLFEVIIENGSNVSGLALEFCNMLCVLMVLFVEKLISINRTHFI